MSGLFQQAPRYFDTALGVIRIEALVSRPDGKNHMAPRLRVKENPAMNKTMRNTLAVLAALLLAPLAAASAAEVVPLAGDWRCALDPRSEGEAKEWFKTELADRIRLPGTTDEAQMGTRNVDHNFTLHLSRVYRYAGAAWYQRDILIPEAWRNQTITLLLERTKNSRVWVDDQFRGEQDSLAAPHVYEISRVHQSAGRLEPGRHCLTICINNAKHPPVNGGHQLSEDTQTDWNGILGRIELQARAPAWIETQRVFAKNDGNIRVELGLRNELSASARLSSQFANNLRDGWSPRAVASALPSQGRRSSLR